jgi:tetratricopeptide (TPR) repeat protein
VRQKAKNQNILLGAFLGIVIVAGVPAGVLAQSSPVVVSPSAQLEEAKKLEREATELYQQGKYDEAIILVKQILEIREKALGPNHPAVAASLNNLAELYRNQGNYAEAEPLFQQSLAIVEKAFGPEHPLVAGILQNLAELYLNQGNYAEAESFLKRSQAIREKALSPELSDIE